MKTLEIETVEFKKLNYLVHYYTDENYLFQTIMMYSKQNLNEVSDNIVKNKTWFWERYRDTDRDNYYKRRYFVEKTMKKEFEEKYFKLSEDVPVYFYLIPGINKEEVINNCNKRITLNNITKALLIDIETVFNNKYITFTVNDSFRCYLKKSLDAGIDCSKSHYLGIPILEDHNKIFPIKDLMEINEKYKNTKIDYEVQIWEKDLLEKIKLNNNNYVN